MHHDHKTSSERSSDYCESEPAIRHIKIGGPIKTTHNAELAINERVSILYNREIDSIHESEQ